MQTSSISPHLFNFYLPKDIGPPSLDANSATSFGKTTILRRTIHTRKHKMSILQFFCCIKSTIAVIMKILITIPSRMGFPSVDKKPIKGIFYPPL
ncbi:hypothetical protein B4084_0929 [Bacillus cereus]|nr:hypothetical protein B4084_0929 [Bacillus cereus]